MRASQVRSSEVEPQEEGQGGISPPQDLYKKLLLAKGEGGVPLFQSFGVPFQRPFPRFSIYIYFSSRGLPSREVVEVGWISLCSAIGPRGLELGGECPVHRQHQCPARCVVNFFVWCRV